MTLTEIVKQLRGMLSRGEVTGSADTAETQTVDVQMWAGHVRSGVEVMQPFGLASRPPTSGLVVLLAVAGDQSDLVALPVASPGNRLGNLAEGEAAVYGILGNRVHCKADGTVHVVSALRVLAEVGEHQVELSEDVARMRLGTGTGAPRVTVTGSLVKLRIGSEWIALQDGAIYSSRPIVVGPDPDPSV